MSVNLKTTNDFPSIKNNDLIYCNQDKENSFKDSIENLNELINLIIKDPNYLKGATDENQISLNKVIEGIAEANILEYIIFMLKNLYIPLAHLQRKNELGGTQNLGDVGKLNDILFKIVFFLKKPQLSNSEQESKKSLLKELFSYLYCLNESADVLTKFEFMFNYSTPMELFTPIKSFYSSIPSDGSSIFLKTRSFICNANSLIGSFFMFKASFNSVMKENSENSKFIYDESQISNYITDFLDNQKLEFTSNDIKDFLKLFSRFRSETYDKFYLSKNNLNYFLQNISIIISKIFLAKGSYLDSNHFFQVEGGKQIFSKECYLLYKEHFEEVFSYLNEFRNLYHDQFVSLINMIEAFSNVFAFFHDKNELQQVKNLMLSSKNSTSLYVEIKKRILQFNRKAKSEVALLFPAPLLAYYKKNSLVFDFKNSLTKNLNFLKEILRCLETFYILVREDYDMSFKSLNQSVSELDHARAKKVARMQLQQIQMAPLEEEEASLIETIEAEPADSSSSLSTTVMPPLVSAVIEKTDIELVLETIDKMKEILNNNEISIVSSELLKGHFENAKLYFFYFVNEVERFIRKSGEGVSPLSLASHIRNIIICSSTSLEQFFTAFLVVSKNIKKSEDLKPYRAHDLLKLCAECSFNPPLKQKTSAFIRKARLGEIWTRETVNRIVGNFNPSRPDNQVKKLLAASYIFSQGSGEMNKEEMFREFLDYMRNYIESFLNIRNYFSEKISNENLEQFQVCISDLFKHLRKVFSQVNFKNEAGVEPSYVEFSHYLQQKEKMDLSTSCKINLENLRFLTQIQELEMSPYEQLGESKKSGDELIYANMSVAELSFTYSRIMQQNQIILEEFLFFLLEMKGEFTDHREFSHDLAALIKKLKLDKIKFTSEEKSFLESGNRIRFDARYLSFGTEGLVRSSKKEVMKKKKRTENSVRENKKIRQMINEMNSSCRTMQSIVNKIIKEIEK